MQSADQSPAEINREVLLDRVRAALSRGNDLRSQLIPGQALRDWQAERRRFMRLACAPRPPQDRPSPLVSHQWTRQRNGYRIEGVLIQVRPGQTLPAHFYIPNSTPQPVAGVLICSGHAFEGKAYPEYQQAGALVAQNGMVALVTEPWDQGERLQDRKPDGGHNSWGTQSHNNTGAKALLVGWSQAGLEAWDGTIALDALAAREEVNGQRLGVMGNSGGGTQAAQLFALDSRLGATAPSCYLTSHASLAGAAGPQDAEQWHLGSLHLGLDHADYLAMRAPAAALICATEEDFFPIEGTRSCAEQSGMVYGLTGHRDRLRLVVAPGEHGWHAPLQQAAVAWMAQHLEGRTITPKFDETIPMDPQEARVTPSGWVLDLPEEATLATFLTREADHLALSRSSLSQEARMESIRQLTGIRPVDSRPQATWEPTPDTKVHLNQKGILSMEDGMVLPAARSAIESKAAGSSPPHLIVGRGAWHHGLGVSTAHETLWIDPMTMGDAQPDEDAWYGYFGHSARDAAWCFQLGETLVGRQAEQILAAARLLSAPPLLIAGGFTAIAALHASALEPGLFAGTELKLPFPSWRSLFARNDLGYEFAFIVPGALAAYDLPDLGQ